MDNKDTGNFHAYKLCPKCSFFCHLSEADKFCSLCGAELIEKCPTCLELISNPYAKYCKKCGVAYPGKVLPQKHKQSF